MGNTWEKFKENWPLLILHAVLASVVLALVPLFASIITMTGLPLWSWVVIIVGLTAFFFAIDIRAARKKGKRFNLRVSHDRTKIR